MTTVAEPLERMEGIQIPKKVLFVEKRPDRLDDQGKIG